MGSSQQSTNSTTNAAPWSVQTPYLQQGFQGASNALSTAQNNINNPNYAAPTAFTAGLTPEQLATFHSMAGYNNGAPGQAYNYGAGALSTGAGEMGGAASGLAGFNPFATNNINQDIAGGNAYAAGANIPAQVRAAMFPAVQTARDITLPGMASASNIGANENNSREALSEGMVTRGLAENAQNLAGSLEGNYYNTGAGLTSNANAANNSAQLAALGTQGNLGNATGGVGLGALNQSIGNQGQIYGIQGEGGQGLQGGQQAGLTNQLQGFNFGQSSPFQALQNFWNVIGSGSWGGTSNTQGQTTYTPSMASTIGGLMGAGGSLLGQRAGPFGGGSGLFGLAGM